MDRSADFRDMFLDDSFALDQSVAEKARQVIQQAEDADEPTIVHQNSSSKRKSRKQKNERFDLDNKTKGTKASFDLDDKLDAKRKVKENFDLDAELSTKGGRRKSSRSSSRKKDKVSSQGADLDSGLLSAAATSTGKPAAAAAGGFDLDSQCDEPRSTKAGAASSKKERLGASAESAVFASLRKMPKLSKLKSRSTSKKAAERQVNLDNILDTVDEEASASMNSAAGAETSGTITEKNALPAGGVAPKAVGNASNKRTHMDLDHTDLDHYSETSNKVATVPLKPENPKHVESKPAGRINLDSSLTPNMLPTAIVNSTITQKPFHDVPLGHPEAPLQPEKASKAVAKGKTQPHRIPRQPLVPIAVTIVCCLFGALTLLILGFNFMPAAEDELYLCGVCPLGTNHTVSAFVFESNATVETMQGMSCDDLEIMANGGAFSKKQCTIVNELAKDVCGCREPTESPTVSPAPTTDPTRAPTGSPTSTPTVAPTTLAPSTAAPTGHTAAPMLYTPSPLPPTPPFVSMSQNRDYDRFNYRDTEAYSTYNDFGPKDWGKIRCRDQESCLGWPDTWEYANGWDIDQNHCLWCPEEGGNRCGRHHQSPIDLRRSFAIPGTPGANECLDVHLMNFHDSTCTVQKLREKRAFAVDRHALRILQPVKWVEERNRYYLDCRNDAVGGMRFGRIDFSFGFSNWWYLSHTDFHMPSEHTQDGKRYDAELQMYHFYSVDAEEAGVNNEMGTVAVFLQAYDDADDYELLNEIICGWREEEERVRRECGLPSVTEKYPGCPDYAAWGGRRAEATDIPKKSFSVNDILLQNHINAFTNSSFEPLKIALDKDEEGQEMLQGPASTYKATHTRSSKTKKENDQRSLFLDESTVWNNYFPLVDVGTEYYYRYSGTQTVPPCYGQFFPGEENRRQTNHWRVMKDPIRVSHRQITEMHRLTRERIAPRDDPVAACRRDTAAQVDRHTGRVNTARPLQKHHEAHFSVFCECDDWRSASEQDKAWCGKSKQERFYEQPYNFESNGF